MNRTTRLLTPLVVFALAGCKHVRVNSIMPGPRSAATETITAEPLQASPNKLVGRILAIDPERGFAIVDLTVEPPAAALAAGAELIARTDDLRETARLRASRHARGQTLGTEIVSGKPRPGDEVVIFAP